MPQYPYFKESAIAHKWLDPLAEAGCGIEIGASAHNDFFIKNMINVDYTSDMNTCFKQEEIKLCGQAAPVDVIAFADDLPFPDSHFDFLLNSHVFEHQCNPIKTLKEWHRIVKDGGIIMSVIPHRDALEVDKVLPITSLQHQADDYRRGMTYETHPIPTGHSKYGHYHIYNFDSYQNLIILFNSMFGNKLEIVDSLDVDDKVGNGYTFIHKVIK